MLLLKHNRTKEEGNEMSDNMAMEIEQMLVEAWKKFFDYYNKKVPEYPKSWGQGLDKKGAKESHWICWNEYDLMFHIGRFFYEALKKKEEREGKKGDNKFSNIEIHFEKNINSANFKGYKFEGRLDELKENLKMKKGPKVDMIVTYEDKNDPFLVCAEVKYLHSASEHYQKTPIEKITNDIKKLKAIRDCGIAKKVIFMLFDDYYWFTDEKTAKGIEDELKRIEKDENIKVLSDSSNAKLEKYQCK